MQITWFKDFVELARVRSFTKAAENRHVTHPAFGRRIKSLEEWAGVPLIERSVPVELTADGIVLLEAATHILETLRVLHDRLSTNGSNDVPDLTIATGVAISATFFPSWYKELCDKIDVFRASVMTGSHEKAMAGLISQEADLLLAYSSYHTRLRLSPAQFEWITIAHEKLVPISKPDTTGAPLYNGMNDRSDPALTFTNSTVLNTIMNRFIDELETKPNINSVHQTDSYSSCLELAINGLGMTWLPLSLVQSALDNKTVVLIDNHQWFIPVDIALYRRKFFSHPIVDRIWSYYLTQ